MGRKMQRYASLIKPVDKLKLFFRIFLPLSGMRFPHLSEGKRSTT